MKLDELGNHKNRAAKLSLTGVQTPLAHHNHLESTPERYSQTARDLADAMDAASEDE